MVSLSASNEIFHNDVPYFRDDSNQWCLDPRHFISKLFCKSSVFIRFRWRSHSTFEFVDRQVKVYVPSLQVAGRVVATEAPGEAADERRVGSNRRPLYHSDHAGEWLLFEIKKNPYYICRYQSLLTTSPYFLLPRLRYCLWFTEWQNGQSWKRWFSIPSPGFDGPVLGERHRRPHRQADRTGHERATLLSTCSFHPRLLHLHDFRCTYA